MVKNCLEVSGSVRISIIRLIIHIVYNGRWARKFCNNKIFLAPINLHLQGAYNADRLQLLASSSHSASPRQCLQRRETRSSRRLQMLDHIYFRSGAANVISLFLWTFSIDQIRYVSVADGGGGYMTESYTSVIIIT